MAVTEREKIELYALDAEGLAYAPSWGWESSWKIRVYLIGGIYFYN